MLSPGKRRLARWLIALVAAPALLVALVSGGMGLLGLGGYLTLAFGVILWDFSALWRALSNRWSSFISLLAPRNLLVMAAYVIVFGVWGIYVLELWHIDRTAYALAYAVATAVTALALVEPRTRRLRTALIVAYNAMGTLALGAWAAADAGSDPGGLLSSAAQGWGVVQALVFHWGAYFAPMFFLPPLLVIEPREGPLEEGEEEGPSGEGQLVKGGSQEPGDRRIPRLEASEVHEASLPAKEGGADEGVVDASAGGDAGDRPLPRRGPVRRVASVGVDAALGGFTVLLLVFAAVGAGNIASWSDLPDPDAVDYPPRDDFEFAALGRAFTDRHDPVPGWREVVVSEVVYAVELGLDYIRYDLHQELIDDPEDMARLDEAVGLIRGAGLDVMLSPFGSGRWEAEHPSFSELAEELARETRVLVERYEPAWVLPFFEPNGQVAVNLGEMRPARDWIPVIDGLAAEVHSISNRTRVLIEVAVEPEEGLRLVEQLSAPGLAIDAIGVDLYPLSAEVLDDLEVYRARATNPDLGFWISEFGVESVMSGQEGQARALSSALERATGDLNGTGICVWSLLDDTAMPSNLGLVGRDGTPKEAYRVLGDAISQVRARA